MPNPEGNDYNVVLMTEEELAMFNSVKEAYGIELESEKPFSLTEDSGEDSVASISQDSPSATTSQDVSTYVVGEEVVVGELLTELVMAQLTDWVAGSISDWVSGLFSEDEFWDGDGFTQVLIESQANQIYHYEPKPRDEDSFVYLIESLIGDYQQKTQLTVLVDQKGDAIAYGEEAIDGLAGIDVPWIASFGYLIIFTRMAFQMLKGAMR